MQVKEIDHICFAVRNLNEAGKTYEGVLGLQPACTYESVEESIRVVRYYLKDVAIELLEPTTPDCEVARFIQKKGEGLFLISYRVDDVEQALHGLKDAGHRPIDDRPRTLLGNRYAFIQPPRLTHGVLIEVLDGRFVDPQPGENETQ
jgi:methylmalonyl-CoA/ethylmalonyl-CoA epimerase